MQRTSRYWPQVTVVYPDSCATAVTCTVDTNYMLDNRFLVEMPYRDILCTWWDVERKRILVNNGKLCRRRPFPIYLAIVLGSGIDNKRISHFMMDPFDYSVKKTKIWSHRLTSPSHSNNNCIWDQRFRNGPSCVTCNLVHFFRISFDIPESWLESFQDLRARCQCQIRSEAIIGIHPDLLSSLAEVTYILDMLFEYRYRPLMQISLWKHQLRRLYQMLETSSIRWCPVALVIGPNWVRKYIITRNTVYVVSDAPLAEFDSLAGAK